MPTKLNLGYRRMFHAQDMTSVWHWSFTIDRDIRAYLVYYNSVEYSRFFRVTGYGTPLNVRLTSFLGTEP